MGQDKAKDKSKEKEKITAGSVNNFDLANTLWPRYEDGTLVNIGDKINSIEVVSIQFFEDSFRFLSEFGVYQTTRQFPYGTRFKKERNVGYFNQDPE